jgi:polysaccharide biosynthesis transport protein
VSDVGPEEMTLRDYAAVIWRRKWIVVLPVLLTTLVATGLSLAQTPQYRASAQVLVKVPPTANNLGATNEVLSPRAVENEFEAAKGSALRSVVRETIGNGPTLAVSVSDGSDVFTFTATSSDAELAALAANTYAQLYIDQQRSLLIDEYSSRIAVLQDQMAAIDRGEVDESRRADFEFQLENLALSTELARTSGSLLIDEATPPGAPFEPNTMRTAMLAMIVGLLLGLGAAFLLDYLDTSVRGEEELARVTGLPNLATIPNLPNRRATDSSRYLITRAHPHSPAAEAFRGLQTAVRFLELERPLRRVLVTSSSPGEGKTTTATNLAITAARSGQRVVLVDCDLRKPQAHLFFGIPNDEGFTSVLLGESTMQQVAQVVPDAQALAVITSGPLPPNASELLSGERARSALEALGESVDLVILDSPPVLPVADPVILAGLVDGVVLVVSAGTTDRRRLSKALSRLAQVDAPMLGTVLNRDDPDDTSEYSYGTYSGTGRRADDPPSDRRNAGDSRPQPENERVSSP